MSFDCPIIIGSGHLYNFIQITLDKLKGYIWI